MAAELQCPFVVFDAALREEVEHTIKQLVYDMPHIDAVINCLDIPKVTRFLESTDEDWLDVFRVNFLGIVYICQASILHMQQEIAELVLWLAMVSHRR